VHRSASGALVALVLYGVAPATAAAGAEEPYGEAPASASRPAYRTLRFEEDWSALRDPAALPARDLFDPVKFIALSDDGALWLSLGAQARTRTEGWSDFDFGGVPGDDTDDVFLETRLRLHADLHLGPALRLFAEAKSALVTHVDLPGGATPVRRDRLDLQNGFVELTPEIGGERPLVLRAGRQELLFGAQRLVSPSDWTNARRTFDGATAALRLGAANVTGFWTRPVRVRERQFNRDNPGNDQFFGVYGSSDVPGELWPGAKLDLYWLGRARQNATVNGTSGSERRQTFGGRLIGTLGDSGLDFETEAALQLGRVGDASLRSGMVSSELGWWLVDWPLAPRFFAGFDWASGDGRPGGKAGTFDPLFPLGHRFFGELDLVGRRNLLAGAAGVTVRPLTGVTAGLSYQRFWRASNRDALYDATGQVLRFADGGSRSTGSEIDLVLGWRFDPHTQLGLGYGHFFAGDFVEQTGRSRDVDLVYFSIQYTL